MKEIRDIIHAYDTLDKTTVSLALATVIDVKGSSYRRTGARMLIQENGFWTGGISGGCIEGNALKKANLAILEAKARVVTYDTENDDESQIGVSLGCNGVISVLIAPIDPGSRTNQIEQLRIINDQRKASVLITVVHSALDSLAAGDVLNATELQDQIASISDEKQLNIQQDIDQVYSSSKSVLTEYGTQLTLFIEFIPPVIQLIVAGGNYDVIPLLEASRSLGWRNVLISNPRRLSDKMRSLSDTNSEDLNDVTIDNYTVAVIMSHDYKADLNNLRKALSSDLNYIGLLGPAVRRNDMIEELSQEGIQIDESKIFGPAGLDIGANQPEEIAIAIIAEIIANQRERSGQLLRLRKAPINDRV